MQKPRVGSEATERRRAGNCHAGAWQDAPRGGWGSGVLQPRGGWGYLGRGPSARAQGAQRSEHTSAPTCTNHAPRGRLLIFNPDATRD